MKKAPYLIMVIFIAAFVCSGCGFSVSGAAPPGEAPSIAQPTPADPTDADPTDADQSQPPQTSSDLWETPAPQPTLYMQGSPQSERETGYEVYAEAYESDRGGPYVYCQIRGLGDAEREERINQVLKEAATSWLCERAEMARSGDPYVQYQAERYLSIWYEYYYPEHRLPSYFYVHVTIDMETGNRVFLRDLVDISPDFLHRIRTGGADVSENNDRIQSMSDEELLAFLDSCQMDDASLRQYIEDGGYTSFLNGFSVFTNLIILTWGEVKGSTSDSIKLDGIEEFLKVPKW